MNQKVDNQKILVFESETNQAQALRLLGVLNNINSEIVVIDGAKFLEDSQIKIVMNASMHFVDDWPADVLVDQPKNLNIKGRHWDNGPWYRQPIKRR